MAATSTPRPKSSRVDINPRGLWQGLRTADLHIRADARATAEAVDPPAARARYPPPGLAQQCGRRAHSRRPAPTQEFAVTPGTLDPRPVLSEIDDDVPKDWDVIVAGGHCFSFTMTHLKGRPGGKYHIPIDFGAIGSGLSAAIGVAVARGNDKVMLIDGDGSLYQHIQELETVRRHGLKLLICILNDGGYGAETHKFRATGGDPNHATHGRGDIAAIARGFGLEAARVTEIGQFERLFRDYQQSQDAHAVGRPYR